MESEQQAGPDADEAIQALLRLEQALDRIGLMAHPDRPRSRSGSASAAEIAGRLDVLIARLRKALAERPGQD